MFVYALDGGQAGRTGEANALVMGIETQITMETHCKITNNYVETKIQL